MSDGLAARVRHLEDRAEIEELIARYAVAVDERDFDTQTLAGGRAGSGGPPIRGRPDAIVRPLMMRQAQAVFAGDRQNWGMHCWLHSYAA